MNEIVNEGDFPHAPEVEKTTLVKQAEMWFRIDGVLHKATELFNRWKTHMEAPRGPDPDYRGGFSSEDAAELLNMVSVLAKRRPVSFNNGDGEDSSGVKKWLATVGAGLAVLVIVAAWSQSSQLATATVKIDYLTLRANDTQIAIHEVQDHQKAQDELIARIREQLDVARARSPNP